MDGELRVNRAPRLFVHDYRQHCHRAGKERDERYTMASLPDHATIKGWEQRGMTLLDLFLHKQTPIEANPCCHYEHAERKQ